MTGNTKRLTCLIIAALLCVPVAAAPARHYYWVEVYSKTGHKLFSEPTRGPVNYTADSIAFRSWGGLSRTAAGQITFTIRELSENATRPANWTASTASD